MQRIEVNNIRLYAYHGCLPEEAKIGGNYLISLYVDADFTDSYRTDALEDTVDYVLLNSIVAEEMAVRSNLIEHVAHRILKRMKASNRRISRAGVKINKLSPPINGDVADIAIWIEE